MVNGNNFFKVCIVLLIMMVFSSVEGGIFSPPVVNPSFELRVLEPGGYTNDILRWPEHGWVWEEYGTGITGNGIPFAPDGKNWGGLGGGGGSYIYQQIGTYTGPLTINVSLSIGLRENYAKGPIVAALWIGGDELSAGDSIALDTVVGATMVEHVIWGAEELGGFDGEDFGVVDVSAQLNAVGDWPANAPIWLQLENVGNDGNGQMFVDNIKVTPSEKAWGPDPANRSENVFLNKTLSWHTAPADPNYPLEADPEVTKHYLFMSDAIDTSEPNSVYDLHLEATIDASGPAQYTPPGGLERDRLYLWRVDEGIGDNPSPDPNFAIVGQLWRFETIGYKPVLEAGLPESAMVEAGEDVLFTISAMNPYTYNDSGLSYQWYQVVKDGDDLEIGEDSPSYAVTGAQIEDEGEYYCRVTIDSTSAYTDSHKAILAIKRLMAHWPLDGDPNDIVGDIEGEMFGPIVWGDGLIGEAAYFEDKLDTRIRYSTETLQRRMWTISLWVYSPESNAKNDWEDVIGSGPSESYAWHYFYITLVAHPDWCEFLSAVQVGLDESGYVPWTWWPYPKEVWYNLVATYDARTETHWFYVNGERIDNADKSADPFMEFGPYLSVGADFNSSFDWAFTGWVDDIRFYSYPLDNFEVADLYMEGTGAEEACLFRPWPDLSGNCRVDIDDFAQLSGDYLTAAPDWYIDDSDLDDSKFVDIGDVIYLLDSWMVCNMYPTCVSP